MGRNPINNQTAKEKRREEIVSSALELFASKGYSATKINHIAHKTGMSQGLLYHYFPSKAHIYVEIIRLAFSRLNEACLSLEDSPFAPGEKISKALDALVENLDTNPDAARYHVLIAQASLSDAVPTEARRIIASESCVPYDVIERIMEAGQKDGAVKNGNPRELATAFWTTIKGLALHKAVHGVRAALPDASLFKPLFLI